MNKFKKKEVFFLGLILLLILAFLVKAGLNEINTFNNTLTSENLTFGQKANLTRYLEINQNATITSAIINFTGYNNSKEIHYNSSVKFMWGYILNQSDGFSLTSAGISEPQGIAYNGSDFWIIDYNDKFVYHLNSSGQNDSDGFSTVTFGSSSPRGIAFNGSTFRITDDQDDFVYHVNITGENNSDGFNTASIFGEPYGIYTNNSDFWIFNNGNSYLYNLNSTGGLKSSFSAGTGDYFGKNDSSFWVLDNTNINHYNSDGINQNDGFSLGGIGISSPKGVIVSNTDFYVADSDDDFLYHLMLSHNKEHNFTALNNSDTLTIGYVSSQGDICFAVGCGCYKNYTITVTQNDTFLINTSLWNGETALCTPQPLNVSINISNANNNNITLKWTNGTDLSNKNITLYVNFTNTQEYPENSFMEIGNNRIWNYTGNLTASNYSQDFTSVLQNNITGCTAVYGNICAIPFIFHSDSAGILRYFNVNITYNVSFDWRNTTTWTGSGLNTQTYTRIFSLYNQESTSFENCTINFTGALENVKAINESHFTVNASENQEVEVKLVNPPAFDYSTSPFYMWAECDPYGSSNLKVDLVITSDTGNGDNGGGGGGGDNEPVIVITGNISFEIFTDTQSSFYRIYMYPSETETRGINIRNFGGDELTLTLECEDDNGFCKNVVFSETEITLAPNREIIKRIEMNITTPQNVEFGDEYKFSVIVSVFDLSPEQIATTVKISRIALISNALDKFTQTWSLDIYLRKYERFKDVKSIPFPKAIILILIPLLLGFLTFKIFRKSADELRILSSIIIFLVSMGVLLLIV